MNARVAARLLELSRRFDSRPKRERLLLAAAVLSALLLIADQVLLTPLQAELKQAGQQEKALAAQAHLLAQQEQQLKEGRPKPAEIALDQARQRVRPLLDSVHDLQASMLSSDRVEEFLSGLIPPGSALRIVALRTLPVQDIAAALPQESASAAAGSTAAGLQGVYRHGIEIQVEGSYLELLGYVRRIEQAPWRIVLDRLSIEVQQYPQALLTLRLSTFSLEPQWMQLGS